MKSKIVSNLETARLYFCGISESDAVYIVRWRSDSNVFRYFRDPHQLTMQEHLRWYNSCYLLDENRFDWICIEKSSKKKIGVFSLRLLSDGTRAEVSYLLDPLARHKGYATEAVSFLMKVAFDSYMVNQVVAEIHKDNQPSIDLVERLGFRCIEAKGNFKLFAANSILSS